MKTFITDFKTRIDEINEYYSFVIFIDSVETHKNEKIGINGLKEFVPKRDLQKILRSNCFLLLYNLVESSIRNCILAVYDNIHDDSLKYDELSDRIKEVWLIHQAKKAQLSEKNLKKWLQELMEEVIDRDQLVLEKETINISGNLDYENVQKIINTYGFFGKVKGDKKAVEASLNKVKRERNLLTHGNKTFCQSGEIVTMSELIAIKENITSYLDELLINIEIYIDKKRYRK
jgi:hypothetical protein